MKAQKFWDQVEKCWEVIVGCFVLIIFFIIVGFIIYSGHLLSEEIKYYIPSFWEVVGIGICGYLMIGLTRSLYYRIEILETRFTNLFNTNQKDKTEIFKYLRDIAPLEHTIHTLEARIKRLEGSQKNIQHDEADNNKN